MANAALEALKNHQRQLDADGCEVGVSRQALDEVVAAFESLCRTRDDLHEANNRYQQEARDERALATKGVTAVEALIAALTAKDAKLAVARDSKARWRRTSEEQTARAERAEAGERAAHDAANTAIRQRDEARAQLAEANKALEPFAQRCDEAVRPDDSDNDGVTVKTKFLRAARRAREQGGE